MNMWKLFKKKLPSQTKLKLKIKEKEKFYNFIQKYLENNKTEFEIRFGLVSLLDYYIDKEHIQEIFKITDKIKRDEYYIEMAIAWLISICYIKFPKETEEYWFCV